MAVILALLKAAALVNVIFEVVVVLYTKKGDNGITCLLGCRCNKDDMRVDILGHYDELNSILGIAKNNCSCVSDQIRLIQNDIFTLCSEIASIKIRDGCDIFSSEPKITDAHIMRIERVINNASHMFKPFFVVPGGKGAYLDYARSVSRRAERSIVKLNREVTLSPQLLMYANRLNDVLFALARITNGGKEVHPTYEMPIL